MVGFFAGNLIPPAWSLEFAVPLCFIALIAPVLRGVVPIVAASSAGVAVFALAGLPMRLNLIAAGLLGIAAGTAARPGEGAMAGALKLWTVIVVGRRAQLRCRGCRSSLSSRAGRCRRCSRAR